MKTPRDYQDWCVTGGNGFPGILPSLAKHKSTIAVLATGLGKTVILSKVAANWIRGNILCLAHRIELLDQMADTLACDLGYRPTIEQGERGMDTDSMFAAGHVVVGSIQSMITRKRMKKFARNPFGLIIIDECHRATTASYAHLIDCYREMDTELKVLGVTATPNRTDGTALGLVFEDVAYDMGIIQGIDAGWLVDIRQRFAVVEQLDLSKIPLSKNEFGETDFKAADLEALLSQEGPLHAMSRPVLDTTTNGEQAIIFAASVNHAHLWAAVLNHYRPGCAAAIDGSMIRGPGSLRTEIVNRYKSGQLQFLLNFNIATEGFDAPKTAMVVMGRPTKSILVKTQQLGRCTRPLAGIVDGLQTVEERQDAIAASAKPYATVLDFVGNSRHQVVTATDILGGNFDVDIRGLADDIIGARGTSTGNVRDALNKARASLLLAEEEERRRPIRSVIGGVKLDYTIRDVDSFSGSARAAAPTTSRGGATDSQVAALVNLGVSRETALSYSKKQAGTVMTSIRKKRCSIPQARTLQSFGYDTSNLNFAQASDLMEALKANGWKRPDK